MTFTVPCICQFCGKQYGEKGGFSAQVETHGICEDCFPKAMEAAKQGKNYSAK